MKNLILTLFLTISTLSFCQLNHFSAVGSSTNMKFDLHLEKSNTFSKSRSSYGESNFPIGPAMMIGGGAFITAGLLTPSTYVGGSTTEKKPFFQQPKMLPIVTGALFMCSGVVISIGN
jgi:hypothetical protein